MSDNKGLPQYLTLPPIPEKKFGRPTDYLPEYCDRVIEWGRLGKSKAWMCAELDITPQTMDNWCEANPDFLEAITRAVTHSQKWWEDAGQVGMMNGSGFNGNVWSKNVSNRFRKDWTDKTETKNTLQNADGSNIMDPIAALLDSVVNKTRSV